MPDWQAYPSSVSNGINSVDRTYVDPVESIGTPGEAQFKNGVKGLL